MAEAAFLTLARNIVGGVLGANAAWFYLSLRSDRRKLATLRRAESFQPVSENSVSIMLIYGFVKLRSSEAKNIICVRRLPPKGTAIFHHVSIILLEPPIFRLRIRASEDHLEIILTYLSPSCRHFLLSQE